MSALVLFVLFAAGLFAFVQALRVSEREREHRAWQDHCAARYRQSHHV